MTTIQQIKYYERLLETAKVAPFSILGDMQSQDRNGEWTVLTPMPKDDSDMDEHSITESDLTVTLVETLEVWIGDLMSGFVDINNKG